MQTFLPYDDFKKSAKVLDYRRLGKQRVEAKQLLNAIQNGGAWSRHPACAMWNNNLDALRHYHDVMIDEWVFRGYNNNMPKFNIGGNILMPQWFGNTDFHASHRSNLLRKDKTFYSQYGWIESDDLPYIWPKS